MAKGAELHRKASPGFRFSGMGVSFMLPLSHSRVRDLQSSFCPLMATDDTLMATDTMITEEQKTR